MKKKFIFLVLFEVVVLAAVIAAALNALFTVTKINAVFDTCSEEGATEALSLKTKLDGGYLGKSSVFLNLDEMSATVAEYPCFEVTSIRKSYPQTVEMKISERREIFAVQKENGVYAILDAGGTYLYDRDDNVNRMGGRNVLLEGFPSTLGEAGNRVAGEYYGELFSIAAVLSEGLGNLRANLLSVTLLQHPLEGGYFRLRMTEGVSVDIYTPANKPREKAEAAFNAYCDLAYEEKLYGYFDVMDLSDGVEFTVSKHYDTLGN